MWFAVDALENEVIYGRLESDPVHISSLVVGSRVQIANSDLNDWIFVSSGVVEGAFTIRAIRKILGQD